MEKEYSAVIKGNTPSEIREGRIRYLINKGYTCNPETGEVFGVHGNIIKRRHKRGYLLISNTVEGRQHNVLGHQFIFFFVHGYCPKMIDHINMDKSDNRICNLRPTTQQQNSFNTKCKGYSKVKSKNGWRYAARIKHNYKSIYLGTFKTEEDAINAYINAKKKYHK